MNTKFTRVFIIIFLSLLSNKSEVKSKDNNLRQSLNKSLSADVLQGKMKNPTTKLKLVCFYLFTKSFSPDIMNELCTHVNVGFFGITKDNHTLEISIEQEKMLSQIVLLKKKAVQLKIIISVGGAGETGFSAMIINHTKRKIFIRSCMEVIKKFKIDGLDLDWEWPVVKNGNAKEKIKFVQLLHEIRDEFNRHKKKYILSIDVPSVQAVIELGYFINYIADFVDYINVMCYDYHYFTKLYPFTGFNAPLYSSSNDLFSQSINHSIYFWISNSMPREKIVLGIPTYGHTFELIFSSQHSLGAPAKGFGIVGHYGFADYQQICKFLKFNDTVVVYDKISKVPYAYRFPEWISYDDEHSLAIKANYVLEEKLGGAMVFSVNADDFNGTCEENGVPLPLIRKIRNVFFNEV